MKYRISHHTRYAFDEHVSFGMNRACLLPREMPGQTCLATRLTTRPEASTSGQLRDYYGNRIDYFSFERGYRQLEILSESEILLQKKSLPAFESSPAWETAQLVGKADGDWSTEDLLRFEMTLASPRVESACSVMHDYIQQSFSPARPILEALHDLLSRFDNDFEFDPTATNVHTPVSDVFSQKKGVCQDFAHTLLALLRCLHLPARYVSGYIRSYPPPGQERLRGADASHAWVSVHCGDLGWVDIDPTNNCFASDEHITIAWGRDYTDIIPVQGVIIGPPAHTLSVSVDVDPEE